MFKRKPKEFVSIDIPSYGLTLPAPTQADMDAVRNVEGNQAQTLALLKESIIEDRLWRTAYLINRINLRDLDILAPSNETAKRTHGTNVLWLTLDAHAKNVMPYLVSACRFPTELTADMARISIKRDMTDFADTLITVKATGWDESEYNDVLITAIERRHPALAIKLLKTVPKTAPLINHIKSVLILHQSDVLEAYWTQRPSYQAGIFKYACENKLAWARQVLALQEDNKGDWHAYRSQYIAALVSSKSPAQKVIHDEIKKLKSKITGDTAHTILAAALRTGDPALFKICKAACDDATRKTFFASRKNFITAQKTGNPELVALFNLDDTTLLQHKDEESPLYLAMKMGDESLVSRILSCRINREYIRVAWNVAIKDSGLAPETKSRLANLFYSTPDKVSGYLSEDQKTFWSHVNGNTVSRYQGNSHEACRTVFDFDARTFFYETLDFDAKTRTATQPAAFAVCSEGLLFEAAGMLRAFGGVAENFNTAAEKNRAPVSLVLAPQAKAKP